MSFQETSSEWRNYRNRGRTAPARKSHRPAGSVRKGDDEETANIHEYSVCLPVYVYYSVEAGDYDEAYSKAREMATYGFIKEKVNDGDFDADCDPMVDEV